jgi:hypothetical protein
VLGESLIHSMHSVSHATACESHCAGPRNESGRACMVPARESCWDPLRVLQRFNDLAWNTACVPLQYMVLLIVLTYVELRALIGLYNDALVVSGADDVLRHLPILAVLGCWLSTLHRLAGMAFDLQVIMEGLLLGDIAHFIAACMLARSVGGWAGANIAGACIASEWVCAWLPSLHMHSRPHHTPLPALHVALPLPRSAHVTLVCCCSLQSSWVDGESTSWSYAMLGKGLAWALRVLATLQQPNMIESSEQRALVIVNSPARC